MTCSSFPVSLYCSLKTFESEKMWLPFCFGQQHFSEINSAADYNHITQFSSATGLGNKMKLKLLPFSFPNSW